jgi:D-alanyl-D-alanine carboxypeptidase
MSRTTKVTLTASAVTLLCLGASLSASPQVIAETLGHEVEAFSPLDPSTYPGNSQHEPARALDAATAAREHSTMSSDGTWVPSEPSPTDCDASALPKTEAPSLDTADSDGSTKPDDAAPSLSPRPRATSEVSEAEEAEVDDEALDATQESTETPQDHETDTAEEPTPPDVDSPDSLTVIVNKLRPLPEDYVPDDLVQLPSEFGDGTQELRAEAADATKDLFEAAADDGVDLTVVSAYRSYTYQQELYDNYVAQYGVEATNDMSALPGHSEHQTGLALDVDTPDGEHTLQQSFGDTEAGQWLAEHAHEYGFIIRYPQDGQAITGFGYEPWHLRYFGEHAQIIMDGSGLAEIAFDLDPAPEYAD